MVDKASFQAEFKDTIKFLKTTRINENTKALSLPWFLVIGAKRSGKSTFIAQSELEFVLSKKKYQPHEKRATRYCDWWVTDTAIFLDINGDFFQPEHKQLIEINELWQQLLQDLKQFNKKSPCSGILFISSITDILKDEEAVKARAETTTYRLNELQAIFHQKLPLFCCITKMDTLTGFSDFFHDLTQEERQQACGFHLSNNTNPNELTTGYLEWFEQLQQQLWQKQQKTNQSLQRAGNFEWLIQLQLYQPQILDWIKNALLPTPLKLSGIYFTSAVEQVYKVDNPLKQKLPGHTQPKHLLVAEQKTVFRPFFIHELLTKIIIPEGDKLQHTTNHVDKKRNYLGYGISLGVLLLGILSIGYMILDTQKKWRILDQAVANVELQKANPFDITLANRLDLLHTLQTASELNTESFPVKLLDFNDRLANAKQIINAEYRVLLNEVLLQNLADTVSLYLKGQKLSNIHRYAMLKTYLMLGQRLPADNEWLLTYLTSLWQNSLTATQQGNLHRYLNHLLNGPWNPIILDNDLIQRNQSYLQQIPDIELGYIIAKNAYWHTLFNLNHDFLASIDWLTVNTEKPAIVWLLQPETLTLETFKVYARQVRRGNPILGERPHSLDSVSIPDLGTLILERYLTEYTQQWRTALSKSTWHQQVDRDKFLALVRQLAGDNSALWEILSQLQAIIVPEVLNDEVKKQLERILLRRDIGDRDALTEDLLKQQLLQTTVLVEEITQPANKQVAFNLAKNLFEDENHDNFITQLRNTSYSLSLPLNYWVAGIAENAWALTLKNTATYLNEQWYDYVWSTYNSTINRRYPVEKSSDKTISLIDFANFFGPNGLLDNFFKAYLRQFIDAKDAQWQFKTVFNQALPIDPSTLRQLERAGLIQRMYFPKHSEFPSIEFYLQPLQVSPTVTAFNLTIDGQTLSFPPHSTKPTAFYWPGHEEQQATSLSLNNNVIYENKSAWSFFKLLDQVQLTKSSEEDAYMVNITSKGETLLLRLTSKEPIHPFISDILENFKLNKTINE